VAKIGIIVGSLRKESFSKKVAEHVATLIPGEYETEFIEIGHLPLFNQDFEEDLGTPEEYTTFRSTIKELAAVLFVTPEYNRSIPAVLKNALDAGSRPYGESMWDGKPAAIISASPGAISGFGANHHQRKRKPLKKQHLKQMAELFPLL